MLDKASKLLLRGAPVWLSLGVLLLAMLTLVAEPALMTTLRNAVFDGYQRLRPRPYEPAAVRVVDVDDESLERLGQWPWPRTLLAELLDRLRDLGAAAVAFDMTFPEPDRLSPERAWRLWTAGGEAATERTAEEARRLLAGLPDHDRALAASIARGRTITGFVLTQDQATAGRVPARKATFALAGDDPLPFLPAFRSAVTSLPLLEEEAAGNGALNVAPSADGVVRRVQLLLRLGDAIQPTLTAEALRVARGAPTYVVKSSGASGESRFGRKTGILNLRIGDLPVATDASGGLWMHYSHPVAERVVPAWRVLAAGSGAEPAPDLERGIRGATVFIGTSASGLKDLRLDPLGNVVAGAEMHAQAVEQILGGTYLSRPDWAKAAELLFMAGLWAALVAMILRIGALRAALVGGATVAASYLGSWLAFTELRLLLDPTTPALTALAVYLVCSVARQLRTERDKRWIRRAFSSYISPNLVRYLIEHPDELELGGERRDCSFVLSDLAGFTSLVESREPAEVVTLLNEYLDGMVAIALRHEGTLDRIVGDAVAVMFSAPVTQPDHARRAVDCALEMDAFAEAFRRRKKEAGVPIGITRIGVNTGRVTIGNVGGSSFVDYRALGDAVNTASRLESANRHLRTRVCVSGRTVEESPGFRGRPIGEVVLKGKIQAVTAWEPLTRAQAEAAATLAYLEAYRLLEAGDGAALGAFEALVAEHPEDGLAAFHLERLRRGERGVTVVLGQK